MVQEQKGREKKGKEETWKEEGRGHMLSVYFEPKRTEDDIISKSSVKRGGGIQPDTEEPPQLFALLGHPVCSLCGKLPLKPICRTSLASRNLLMVGTDSVGVRCSPYTVSSFS